MGYKEMIKKQKKVKTFFYYISTLTCWITEPDFRH